MNKPLVTIVMPLFNAQHYIHATVRSILDQGLTDIEFAQSALIAQMDANDIALPGPLSLHFDFMQKNSGVVCAKSF